MGRFYETEKSRFLDNFIYEPNYNLINGVLDKEQTGFDKAKADNADLLNKLNIKYIAESEKERLNVANKKTEYANIVDDLTNKVRDTTKDWRSFLPEIDAAKRKLAEDFATGDISRIEESKETWDKHQAHLKTITDVGSREAAEKYYFNDWEKKNPNGSKDNMYSYQDTFDKKDLQKEFNDELLKYNTAKEIGTAYANAGGGYLYSGKDGKKERTNKTVTEIFEEWVKGKNYDTYLDDQQKLGLANYKDASGKLISFHDEKSSMYNTMRSAAKMGEFLETKQDKKISPDDMVKQQREHAHENAKIAAAKAANDKKIKDSMSIAIKQDNHFTKTASGKNQVIAMKKQLFELLPPELSGKTEEQKLALIENLKINGTQTQKEKIKEIELKKNKDMVSGYPNVEEYYGTSIAEAIRNRFGDPDIANKVKTSKVLFDFGDNKIWKNYEKGADKDPDAGLTLMQYQRILANNKNGNNVNTGQDIKGATFYPSKIEYIDNSAAPMFTYDGGKDGLGGSAGYKLIQEEILNPDGSVKRHRVEQEITGTIPTHLIDIDTNNFNKVAPEKRVTSINKEDDN